jgi:hypothetical protein
MFVALGWIHQFTAGRIHLFSCLKALQRLAKVLCQIVNKLLAVIGIDTIAISKTSTLPIASKTISEW